MLIKRAIPVVFILSVLGGVEAIFPIAALGEENQEVVFLKVNRVTASGNKIEIDKSGNIDISFKDGSKAIYPALAVSSRSYGSALILSSNPRYKEEILAAGVTEEEFNEALAASNKYRARLGVKDKLWLVGKSEDKIVQPIHHEIIYTHPPGKSISISLKDAAKPDFTKSAGTHVFQLMHDEKMRDTIKDLLARTENISDPNASNEDNLTPQQRQAIIDWRADVIRRIEIESDKVRGDDPAGAWTLQNLVPQKARAAHEANEARVVRDAAAKVEAEKARVLAEQQAQVDREAAVIRSERDARRGEEARTLTDDKVKASEFVDALLTNRNGAFNHIPGLAGKFNELTPQQQKLVLEKIGDLAAHGNDKQKSAVQGPLVTKLLSEIVPDVEKKHRMSYKGFDAKTESAINERRKKQGLEPLEKLSQKEREAALLDYLAREPEVLAAGKTVLENIENAKRAKVKSRWESARERLKDKDQKANADLFDAEEAEMEKFVYAKGPDGKPDPVLVAEYERLLKDEQDLVAAREAAKPKVDPFKAMRDAPMKLPDAVGDPLTAPLPGHVEVSKAEMDADMVRRLVSSDESERRTAEKYLTATIPNLNPDFFETFRKNHAQLLTQSQLDPANQGKPLHEQSAMIAAMKTMNGEIDRAKTGKATAAKAPDSGEVRKKLTEKRDEIAKLRIQEKHEETEGVGSDEDSGQALDYLIERAEKEAKNLESELIETMKTASGESGVKQAQQWISDAKAVEEKAFASATANVTSKAVSMPSQQQDLKSLKSELEAYLELRDKGISDRDQAKYEGKILPLMKKLGIEGSMANASEALKSVNSRLGESGEAPKTRAVSASTAHASTPAKPAPKVLTEEELDDLRADVMAAKGGAKEKLLARLMEEEARAKVAKGKDQRPPQSPKKPSTQEQHQAAVQRYLDIEALEKASKDGAISEQELVRLEDATGLSRTADFAKEKKNAYEKLSALGQQNLQEIIDEAAAQDAEKAKPKTAAAPTPPNSKPNTSQSQSSLNPVQVEHVKKLHQALKDYEDGKRSELPSGVNNRLIMDRIKKIGLKDFDPEDEEHRREIYGAVNSGGGYAEPLAWKELTPAESARQVAQTSGASSPQTPQNTARQSADAPPRTQTTASTASAGAVSPPAPGKDSKPAAPSGPSERELAQRAYEKAKGDRERAEQEYETQKQKRVDEHRAQVAEASRTDEARVKNLRGDGKKKFNEKDAVAISTCKRNDRGEELVGQGYQRSNLRIFLDSEIGNKAGMDLRECINQHITYGKVTAPDLKELAVNSCSAKDGTLSVLPEQELRTKEYGRRLYQYVKGIRVVKSSDPSKIAEPTLDANGVLIVEMDIEANKEGSYNIHKPDFAGDDVLTYSLKGQQASTEDGKKAYKDANMCKKLQSTGLLARLDNFANRKLKDAPKEEEALIVGSALKTFEDARVQMAAAEKAAQLKLASYSPGAGATGSDKGEQRTGDPNAGGGTNARAGNTSSK